MTKKKPKTPCDACGGTGQLNLFKGESRFLLTTEECPHCVGFGYILEEETEKKKPQKTIKRKSNTGKTQ